MEQLKKYIWLLNALRRSGARGLTLEELQEKWSDYCYQKEGEHKDLPRQTYSRWKKDIEELFGIEIACGSNYRYHIDSEDMEKGGAERWLLDTFSTAGSLTDRMKLKGRILVEEVPSSRGYLQDFLDAMEGNHVLEITYCSFAKGKTYTFRIEPYCVKMVQKRWYVLARSPYYGKMSMYSLDRIENLAVCEEKFKLPDDFDAETYFSSFFGIVVDEKEKPTRIVLRAKGWHKNYMRSLPLHHSQRELCDTDEYADFEYYLRPTYDFIMELMSMNSMVEVLEPQSLHNTMHHWVWAMWEMYKNDIEEEQQ